MLEISLDIPDFVRAHGALRNGELRVGRVLRFDEGRLSVLTQLGAAVAQISGSWAHDERVVAGDWVHLDELGHAVALVPRHNALSRRAAGSAGGEQLIAANIDLVVIMMALDGDFSLRRLERYLLLAHEAGAPPLVLLTKAAAHAQVQESLTAVRSIVGDAPVHAIDLPSGLGSDVPARHILPGQTAVLVGSSGVGKSTLLNHLLANRKVATQPVRERDSKGRHTTTWRELCYLANGGAVIDTPGMREVQLWATRQALEATFGELVELARACRFRDCSHRKEPGCAVRDALANGKVSEERVSSWLRLGGELNNQPRAPRPSTDRVLARALRAQLKRKRGDM